MVLDKVMSAAEDFPSLFRQYITNSIEVTLVDIPRNGALLSADLRDRALHVLSFALKRPDIWPCTRELLLLLAPKLEQAGHRDDWLPYLTAGVKQSLALGDAQTEATLGLQVGRLHYLCSQFAEAEAHVKRSLALFTALGDTHGQACSHNELAWLDFLQHRYTEATRHVEQALALLAPEAQERAMSYRVQGMIAIDQRRWAEAEALHRQALLLFEQQGDKRRIAGSMQNLASTLGGQKKFTEAITHYQQAMQMLEPLGDVHSLGIIHMNLGTTLAFYLNRPADALLHYRQAELIFKRLHDPLNIAKINTGLGLSYLGVKEYKEAENAFLRSIKLFAELKDESLRLNATDGLVMAYLAMGQYEHAQQVAEQAVRELPAISNAPNYHYLLRSLTQHLTEAQQGSSMP
ncbi:MAG: tetratricopeptide repeat protein [Caldilineaceae bacterium]